MNWRNVPSSSIDAVGYNEQQNTLYVRFASGAEYTYDDVTPTEYHALLGANSVGRHFHEHIKSKYKGTKV